MSGESKLRISFLLGLMVIAAGTGGYVLIEHWSIFDSLYMVIVTLSTVGFREIRPLSENGRVFTIFLIIFGASIGAYIIRAVAGLVLEGQLQAILGKRKMEKRVRKLKDHIILCGYGRVGRQVADEFLRREEPFVIIEKDSSMIPDTGGNGLIFIEGSGADDDVLEHAGINRAKAIVSTLPDDADNVYLALTARQISSKLLIIARAESNLAKRKLIRAGADRVISPHELGGSQMAMAALRPNILDFMQLASFAQGAEKLGIEELPIRENGNLTGKSIIEAAIKTKYDSIVIGLRKKSGDMMFNPTGETSIEEGDILIVLGQSDKLEQLSTDLG